MKITAIKQQVKNPDRVSIFIDGSYSLSLFLNELLTEKLRVGIEISENSIKRLQKLSTDGKQRQRALEWILSRPRSERELQDYLRRKKVEPEQIAAWVTDFKNRNYLSDVVFAEWLIDVRRRGNKSERAIRAELSKKGVAREVVQEVMQNKDEQARLMQLISKKRSAARYRDNRQKLMQYLARQGFKFEDIKMALDDDGSV